MTRQSKPVKIGGIILVVFAAIVVMIEIILHVIAVAHGQKYSINYVMLAIAFVTGFTGFYILNPPRAKDGGEFIVDNAIKIIQVMKAGRRKDDPTAVVVQDKNGQTATMVIHPPTETEVSIAPQIDAQARRNTDALLPPTADSPEQGGAHE